MNVIEFIHDVLKDPDNNARPFLLYPDEELFLREALTVNANGRLRYPELVFSAPKKSGKTALAAMSMLYVMNVLEGRFGEGYCVANDLDQSVGRVFRACCRIIEASPMLKRDAKLLATTIEFKSTRAFIEAIPSDYAGAAGANPNFIVFDELWGYTSESSRRLWDEMTTVPTRKISARLTVTYAGFEAESILLSELLKRGFKGELVA